MFFNSSTEELAERIAKRLGRNGYAA